MNCNSDTWSNFLFNTFDGANELTETKFVVLAFKFTCGEIWQEHGGVLVHLFFEERNIEMIAMKMRDVEKIWIADVMHYIFWQLIVTRKNTP